MIKHDEVAKNLTLLKIRHLNTIIEDKRGL